MTSADPVTNRTKPLGATALSLSRAYRAAEGDRQKVDELANETIIVLKGYLCYKYDTVLADSAING